MASEDDGLMPTGMGENATQITSEFNDNSRGVHETDKQEEQNTANIEVQDKVHTPRANPVLRPTWDTSEIDQETFDQAQQNAGRQHAQQTRQSPDEFDRIDAQYLTLSQRFNQRSDMELNERFNLHSGASTKQVQLRSEDKSRDAFEQVDAGLAQNFNARAQGLDRD